MTIREVLEADWTVKHFEATVRDETGKWICSYKMGQEVKPSKYAKFTAETAAGDIYYDNGRKIVVIDKNIQFRNQEHKPKGKEMWVGVLTEVIPRELLDCQFTICVRLTAAGPMSSMDIVLTVL